MSDFKLRKSFLRDHPSAAVGRYGRVRGGWVDRKMNHCCVKILGFTEDGRYIVEFPFPIPYSGKKTMHVPTFEIAAIVSSDEGESRKHREKAILLRHLREQYIRTQNSIHFFEKDREEILQKVQKLK